MICRKCNEHMVGDGYTTPIYCPNVTERQELELTGRECDAAPLYCEFKKDAK